MPSAVNGESSGGRNPHGKGKSMQVSKEDYRQKEKVVKSCTFLLPGEKAPRTCSFQEMMRIIRDRCPSGKLKELRIA